MPVSITVDGIPELDLILTGITNSLDSPVYGIMEAVNQVLIPDVEYKSANTWGVRTGQYSMGWSQAPLSPNAVSVFNIAQNDKGYFYAMPLEYGWITKNGGFVDSLGVLFTSIEEVKDDMVTVISEWIASQAGL